MRKHLVAFSHVLFLSSLSPELPTKPRCMKTRNLLAHGVGHNVHFLCSDSFPNVRLPSTFDCLIFVTRRNLQLLSLGTLKSDLLKVPSRVSSSPDVALSADALSSIPRTPQYKDGLFEVIYTRGRAGHGSPGVRANNWRAAVNLATENIEIYRVCSSCKLISKSKALKSWSELVYCSAIRLHIKRPSHKDFYIRHWGLSRLHPKFHEIRIGS